MPDSTVKERIISFIKYYSLSQKKFEELLGLSNGYVNNIRKGISDNVLFKICDRFPTLNRDWLLYGEGEMLNNEAVVEEVLPEISYTDGVPYYNEDFLLGFEEISAPNSENPEYLIRMPGYEKATLWCNASGHSMEPEINNGDIIAMQRVEDFSFLPFGDIYGFITTNGLRTIKRLGRSTREGFYRLVPTNKNYDEQEIPITKIALVYRVMGAMKTF